MDLIGYDVLVKRAFREVLIKEALRVAAGDDGLPGDHHFYITFRTTDPDVEMPDSLRAQYPDEMTIVLQKRYSQLDVEDDAFGVGLAFAGVPARLHVPYDSILRFFDPAVNFLIDLRPTVAAVADLPAEKPAEKLAMKPAEKLAMKPVMKPVVEPTAEDDDTGEQSAQVLSLDHFRRK